MSDFYKQATREAMTQNSQPAPQAETPAKVCQNCERGLHPSRHGSHSEVCPCWCNADEDSLLGEISRLVNYMVDTFKRDPLPLEGAVDMAIRLFQERTATAEQPQTREGSERETYSCSVCGSRKVGSHSDDCYANEITKLMDEVDAMTDWPKKGDKVLVEATYAGQIPERPEGWYVRYGHEGLPSLVSASLVHRYPAALRAAGQQEQSREAQGISFDTWWAWFKGSLGSVQPRDVTIAVNAWNAGRAALAAVPAREEGK